MILVEASQSYMAVLSPLLAKITVGKPIVTLAGDTLRMALRSSDAYISVVRVTKASKNIRRCITRCGKTGVLTTLFPRVFRKAKIEFSRDCDISVACTVCYRQPHKTSNSTPHHRTCCEQTFLCNAKST